MITRFVWSLIASLSLASPAFSQGLQATVQNLSGETTVGFIIGAEKDGLLISQTADGGNSFKMPFQNIRDYNMQEPNGWTAAVALYQSGDYAQAETQFATIAQGLEKLVPLKDSYGSMAKYYHFMCLRKQGKLKELAAAHDKQLANPMTLSEGFQEDLDDFLGWSILGKQDWVQLTAYLVGYEDKAAKGSLPQAPFKKASRSRLTTLSYLRAMLEEHDGKKDLALLDYQAALTLNLGSDLALSTLAAKSALRLCDELLREKPDNTQLQRQGYALAVVYRDMINKGQLPAEYAKLAEKPAAPAVAPEPEKK